MSFGKLKLCLAFAPFLLACGPDCVALCEEAEEKDCPGWDVPDCERLCSELDDIAFESGCEEEVEAELSCYDEQEDICDGDDHCDDEIADVTDCFTDFCTDHPNNRECAGF